MPRNDFRCDTCGHHATYQSTRATAPWHCDLEMVWAPMTSAAVDAKESFNASDLQSGDRTFHIDSLHAMRKAEAASEQLARNGEGQPLVWRDYSQTRSNFDVHTLAKRLDRPMDAQESYAGGMSGVDKKKVDVARGPDVAKRQGL